MAKKGKKSRDGKSSGKKAIAKLEKLVDRLAARVVKLETAMAAQGAANKKKAAPRTKTARAKAPVKPAARTPAKSSAKSSAKSPARTPARHKTSTKPAKPAAARTKRPARPRRVKAAAGAPTKNAATAGQG